MPRFSHSKIECFRQCPQQYYYQYVWELRILDCPKLPSDLCLALTGVVHLNFESQVFECLRHLIPDLAVQGSPRRLPVHAVLLLNNERHRKILISQDSKYS